jgi:hypothetical protein
MFNAPDRFISRFFLNLRSVYHEDQPMAATSISVCGIATHPFWRRANQGTTHLGFSIGPGGETSAYTDQYERTEPQLASVDLELAIELRTRQDGSELDMKAIDGLTPTVEK